MNKYIYQSVFIELSAGLAMGPTGSQRSRVETKAAKSVGTRRCTYFLCPSRRQIVWKVLLDGSNCKVFYVICCFLKEMIEISQKHNELNQ